jgi:nucleoside-diphosphate-sugar epimerase
MPVHTILGANGTIGRELSRELAARDVRLRQVSRSPRPETPRDEVMPADLLHPAATARAVEGSEVAYLVAGLKYDTRVWQEQWPRVMRNTIEACSRHRVRLVFFDNVYAYGRVNGVMTEETPFNPISRKGEVRAIVATSLLDAMRRGEVEGMIVRAADFYGPRAELSLTNGTIISRVRSGKKPQWIADPTREHTFTYTPDAGRSAAVLGLAPEAYGQTWHALTSGESMSAERFARLACDLAGRPYGLQVAPRWMVRLMGLFVPALRENQELMYQLDQDYRFGSSKIENAFDLRPTAYRDGIAAALAA